LERSVRNTTLALLLPVVIPINKLAVAEKVVFHRLLKNAQMQGPRNPEE
jgi:hypothetical protein